MSASLLRAVARGPSTTFFRANTSLLAARPTAQPLAARAGLVVPSLIAIPTGSNNFSTTVRARSEHAEETFEEFTAR